MLSAASLESQIWSVSKPVLRLDVAADNMSALRRQPTGFAFLQNSM